MTDARTLAPLRPDSKLLRVYWWFLAVAPALNLLLALEPLLTGRPPERAVGGIVTIPMLIATLLLAPVIAVRGLTSPVLGRNQKITCAALSFAAFPMFLLVQFIWSWLGAPDASPSPRLVIALGLITLGWAGVAWWARVVLRRGSMDATPGSEELPMSRGTR